MTEIKAKKVIFKNRDGEHLIPYIGDNIGGAGLEIGDIGFTQMAIDETKGKRRVLNGQLIIQDQYVQFTNIIKNSVALNPSLACTEAEWQTEVTMNTFGLCGKFVIDDEGGTIRLPKYPNYFIAGLANIAPVVGNGLALGITDGSKNLGLMNWGDDNLIVRTGAYGASIGASGKTGTYNTGKTLGVTTDATKSGIEAQINEKQIAGTYFIQVATGAETEDNIINEIELNNPFSLLDYKYSEYELNNLSWLRSNGQYNSKAVYPAVYELLLKIYNGTETKAGVSVKLSTETFTDYDFVLNTADETFRLPIKVKLASGKAVVGNGMTLGLTDGNTQKGLYETSSNYLTGASNLYGKSFGTSGGSDTFKDNVGIGVTTDATKSGLELSDSDLYLYFYVGETVQNANLINAGRIEEHLHSLIPDNSSLISGYSMPSNKYIDLTLGASGTTYTAPANGYFYAQGNFNNANGWFVFYNGSFAAASNANSGTYACYCVIPCKKGETVQADYNHSPFNSTASGTPLFRFIYAEGEV